MHDVVCVGQHGLHYLTAGGVGEYFSGTTARGQGSVLNLVYRINAELAFTVLGGPTVDGGCSDGENEGEEEEHFVCGHSVCEVDVKNEVMTGIKNKGEKMEKGENFCGGIEKQPVRHAAKTSRRTVVFGGRAGCQVIGLMFVFSNECVSMRIDKLTGLRSFSFLNWRPRQSWFARFHLNYLYPSSR